MTKQAKENGDALNLVWMGFFYSPKSLVAVGIAQLLLDLRELI